MAKTIKLPADLRDWKVTSFVEEDNGCEVYKVSRKIDKNTAQNAILRHAFVGKSNYTDERAEYFTEEADFIESVKELDGVSNYLDVYVQDNQNKKTCDLYIFGQFVYYYFAASQSTWYHRIIDNPVMLIDLLITGPISLISGVLYIIIRLLNDI